MKIVLLICAVVSLAFCQTDSIKPVTTADLLILQDSLVSDIARLTNEQQRTREALRRLSIWHTAWGSVGIVGGITYVVIGIVASHKSAQTPMILGGFGGIVVGTWELSIGSNLMLRTKWKHSDFWEKPPY